VAQAGLAEFPTELHERPSGEPLGSLTPSLMARHVSIIAVSASLLLLSN
jgi:hypothetical protein